MKIYNFILSLHEFTIFLKKYYILFLESQRRDGFSNHTIMYSQISALQPHGWIETRRSEIQAEKCEWFRLKHIITLHGYWTILTIEEDALMSLAFFFYFL